jgi:hypothetical protein
MATKRANPASAEGPSCKKDEKISMKWCINGRNLEDKNDEANADLDGSSPD